MSQRHAFCINAATMGLDISRPPSPSDSTEISDCGSPRQQQQPQQQEQVPCCCDDQTPQTSHVGIPGSMSVSGCPTEEQLLQCQQEFSQVLNLSANISKLSGLVGSECATCYQTPQSSCSGLSNLVGFDVNRCSKKDCKPATTQHYRDVLQKLRSICAEPAIIELNSKFVERLEEIDCLDQQCGGDSNLAPHLRLVTFQDWVDILLRVNYIIITSMSDLEAEACKKVISGVVPVLGERQQAQDENRKLRKDMCAIIKLVQEAFHHNIWNTNEMTLETLTVNQLLGTSPEQPRPESETEKVAKCMKSLANEVAAKHDELCSLQSQMSSLDEVVQTARQKLILKDQCIAQLNQQLVEAQEKIASMSHETSRAAQCGICADPFDHLEDHNCLLDSIKDKDQQANELLRMLNQEVSELISLISEKDYRSMECTRKLLSCFFDRINNDREETQHKIDKLRAQLRALDCSLDELSEPCACSTQMCEDDLDMQLINGLRRRLKAINEYNKELNARCLRMEAQQKVKLMEIRCLYEAERAINLKNVEVLKEIADLLSKLRGCDISYEELYTEHSSKNPFCIVIVEMFEKLCELEKDREQLAISGNTSEATTPAQSNYK